MFQKIILKLKYLQVIKKFRTVGTNFKFDPNSSIFTPDLISVGDNVFIGEMAHISADISIGNNVMFGPRPIIVGGNHLFGVSKKSVRFLHPKNRENVKHIKIEDEVWCGAGVIILGNTTIGLGAIVGAGSVVTKDVAPFTISVGNPCKAIKRIFTDKVLESHLKALGYNNLTISEVIERRNNLTKHLMLDTIDNTDTYWDK